MRAFIFDVDKGLLREVQPIAHQTASRKNLGSQDLSPGASGSQEL